MLNMTKHLVVAMLSAQIMSQDFEKEVLVENTNLSESTIDYCYQYGDEYDFRPELLIAIIEAESSGNPNAKNGDCLGLMQVSEKYHTDRMERLGVTDLYDEGGNILVATNYLYELFMKYEDIGMVLMTYNGDSSARKYWNSNGELSRYAKKIINRTEELESIIDEERASKRKTYKQLEKNNRLQGEIDYGKTNDWN